MQVNSQLVASVSRLSGLGIWLAVSLTTITRAQSIQRLLLWSLASAAFLAAFSLAQRTEKHLRLLLALQSAAVVAMVAVLCNGFEGFLLVLIAGQLGWRESVRIGLIWIFVQTAAVGGAIAYEWTPRSALLLTPPYLGFQLLMYALTRLLAGEHAARVLLESSNRKLIELQQQLAQKHRLDERWRMTQELHDVFGHRLTALSLNLEASAHETLDRARSGIQSAQSLVHSLLDDVKALVSAYKDDVPVDLSRELRELARDLPTPRIHLECPIDVQLTDPRVGRALLRCAQEFVTNSIRHGAARNVWIGVAIDVNRARLVARDDGIGATDIRDGFGLSGMRRRMQELGGTLEIKGHLQSFEVSAELPVQLPEHGPAT